MIDPIPPGGLEIAKSAVALRAKAQLRMAVAAMAGMLIGKHILPAGLVDDTMLDAITALIFYGIASAWQDRRAILNHARLWWLARSNRVSNLIVRPKEQP